MAPAPLCRLQGRGSAFPTHDSQRKSLLCPALTILQVPSAHAPPARRPCAVHACKHPARLPGMQRILPSTSHRARPHRLPGEARWVSSLRPSPPVRLRHTPPPAPDPPPHTRRARRRSPQQRGNRDLNKDQWLPREFYSSSIRPARGACSGRPAEGALRVLRACAASWRARQDTGAPELRTRLRPPPQTAPCQQGAAGCSNAARCTGAQPQGAALGARPKQPPAAARTQRVTAAAQVARVSAPRRLQPAGVLGVDGAARPPHGAVGLEAAAKAQLPHAVAPPHAARVLHVGQDVPAAGQTQVGLLGWPALWRSTVVTCRAAPQSLDMSQATHPSSSQQT